MAAPKPIINMTAVLSERIRPQLSIWNRIEGRPRTTDYTRALRAEIRDPLWTLARQYQTGEFDGDDAGSPIHAIYQLASSPLTAITAPDGPPQALGVDVPHEAVAEAIPWLRLATGGAALDQRARLGQRFLAGVPAEYHQQLVARYGFELPDPASDADFDVQRVAHLDVWATLQALAGRALDGIRVYDYLNANAAHRITDGLSVTAADRPVLQAAADRLRTVIESQYVTPPATQPNGTWDPTQLKHRFTTTVTSGAGGVRVLRSDEYPGGRLDWTSFSLDPTTNPITTYNPAGHSTGTCA